MRVKKCLFYASNISVINVEFKKKMLANSLYLRLWYALRFSFKVHNGGAVNIGSSGFP